MRHRPVTETRVARVSPQVAMWLGRDMGAEVSAQSYTREERQRYREKVRQNLDVFERMLNTSSFEFDRPMTGLEIELNLVDERHAAALPQRRGARGDRRRGLPDRARAVQHRAQRAASAAARRLRPRARGGAAREPQPGRPGGQGGRLEDRRDRHPADDHARALRGRVDQPQQPLHGPQRLDLRRPRRGHLPRHRGSHRGAGGHRTATRSRRSPPARRCSCTSRSRRRSSPPTGTPPRRSRHPGRPGGELPVLLRQAAPRRDAHRALQAGHRHPAGRAEEPGRAARVFFGERWITSIFDLFEENVRYFPTLLAETSDEDPMAKLEAGVAPRSSPSCGCTTAPSTGGTARSTTSSAAPRTCGSRTASCRPARPSSTSWPTPPSTTARSGCSPTRTAPSGPR